jgi:hypothetical protein
MPRFFQTLQEQLQHTLCAHNSFSEQQSTEKVERLKASLHPHHGSI